MAFLLLLLILSSESDEAHLTLRAFPRMSVAPAGVGCSNVLITAEIKGAESERLYCPGVEWLIDGVRAFEESDCPPFAEREEYPRIWRRRVCLGPHPLSYEIAVTLSRAGKPLERQTVTVVVK